MSRKWDFAFLNTAITSFCLIYSLNIHHSKKKLSFFHPDRSISISSQYVRRPCYTVWWDSHTKINLAFLSLTIITGDGLVSGFSDKYKVHILFIVSRASVKFHLSIQSLLIVMGNPITKACLGIAKHDWTLIVSHWTNRKYFLFARDNIWNSKLAFYNETTSLLRHGCLNRDLSVVTPL